MTSSQVYQSLPGAVDPTQMCGDISAGLSSTDWYSPGLYSYQDSFVTPYAPSLIEGHSWPGRSSGIGHSYALLQNISLDAAHSTPPQHTPGPHSQQPSPRRPSKAVAQGSPAAGASSTRRAASAQGSYDSTASWPSSNGLGIQYTTAASLSTAATSTFAPGLFQTYPIEEESGTVSSPPELQQPKPTRPYPNIAPHPVGAGGVKRARDDDDFPVAAAGTASGTSESTPTGGSRKRKRTSSVISNDLNEDDRFLVQLKEDENLPWKEIATRFLSDKGKTLQVAALQMRYKRLREKFRTWEDQDMNALRLAHEYWEKYKWEIISAKMLDFGIEERWPVRNCARKWQELEAGITSTASPPPQQQHQQQQHNTKPNVGGGSGLHNVSGGFPPSVSTGPSMLTPALTTSQFSSPIETTAPMQFSFMPMQ